MSHSLNHSLKGRRSVVTKTTQKALDGEGPFLVET